MDFRLVDSEEPHIHWQSVYVSGKRVLDLGCGDFGRVDSLPYPSTLEYFLSLGADYVVGVDSSYHDINNINFNLKEYQDKFSIKNQFISSMDMIVDMIRENDIHIIKSDIEGGEIHLLSIPDETFSQIEEYYIETHGEQLYNMTVDKLVRCGYEIYDKIDLIHTNGECKVIFARKI